MKGEIDYNLLKEILRDIIPLQSGGSFRLLWDMLYHIRLLKYVRRSQLKQIDIRYSKICSSKKLKQLCDLGLLQNTYEDVFIVPDNALTTLKQSGYNLKSLPKSLDGDGKDNELNNTIVFLQAIKLPDFIHILYPTFDYIKPDALLIRGNKEKYKLEFLEVEASKSNWNDWLENKRINYLKLARDKQVYSYWKAQCNYLDMPIPDINDFKFSVSVIGSIKKDFGEGFNFMENICRE